MRFLLMILLMILVSQTVTAEPHWSQRVQQLEALLARADSLLTVGRADEVVRMLPPVVANRDLGTEVLWPLEQRLGLAYQELGRYDEALPHLERAVLWAQRDPVNHRNLAHLLLQMGKRGRAFSEYRDACSLAPGDWAVRVEFGHVLMDFQQLGPSARVLAEAEAECSDCPEVLRALVRLNLLRGDHQSALAPVAALHAVSPSPEIREQYALILLRTGGPEQARDLLLPHWPDGLSGSERRIMLESDRLMGDASRALALAGIDQPGWEDPDLWGLAALICYDAEADEAGLSHVDRAIGLAPGNASYRNNRVALLMRLGRQVEADAEWAIVLQLDPSLAENRQD